MFLLKNRPIRFIFFLLILAPFCSVVKGQSFTNNFRIMFYNVENLFDVHDNPLTSDEDFTPGGVRHWTYGHYYDKIHRIGKVISSLGGWQPPDLVGLCEVENDSVVSHLCYRTSLRRYDYRYYVTKGNDPRGIDVALLYQRDRFNPIQMEQKEIRFSQKKRRSRPLLHVAGEVLSGDTIDVLVVHLPSKYGGALETNEARKEAAQTLFSFCDSLQGARGQLSVIVMGDFNDTPDKTNIPSSYINLFATAKGSHKYQGVWSQLDQMIINRSLLRRLNKASVKVFRPSFLLKKDKTWRGNRPFRTYYGYSYEGGFSDHLPIMADFDFSTVF